MNEYSVFLIFKIEFGLADQLVAAFSTLERADSYMKAHSPGKAHNDVLYVDEIAVDEEAMP